MPVGERGGRTELEGKAVRRTGQFADARLQHRGAPCNRAAQHVVGADNLADLQLGNAVLQRNDHAVGRQVGDEPADDLLILHLFGEQDDDVVGTVHLLGGEGADRLDEVHRTRHVRAVLAQSLDVGDIVVDQVNLPAILGDECAEDGTHRSGTVYRCSHLE